MKKIIRTYSSATSYIQDTVVVATLQHETKTIEEQIMPLFYVHLEVWLCVHHRRDSQHSVRKSS